MGSGINLYELMHAFWKENDYEPFPASATAMFFFLLDRANSRHWNMPIRCPTTHISRALMVSEQTVINSRNVLYRRGIITFTKGTGNTVAPRYTIVTNPKDWEFRLGDNLNDDLAYNLSDHLTDDSEDGLNIYNNEDKKIKDQISSIYKAEEKRILSIDELEKLFLSDKAWQANLIFFLSADAKIGSDTLQRQISYFFQLQKCSGIDRREEKECRTHFTNWIKKQLKENPNGIHKQQREPDKRRGSDITAVSAKEYDGAF